MHLWLNLINWSCDIQEKAKIVKIYVHPSKKVTQHDFDQLYFFDPGFLFLKFDIPRKPDCLFAFRLMPYLLGLFHWGACRMSKLGVKSKRKSCKIDQIVWEMHVMPSFWLYARIYCPFIVPKSSAHWMGSGYPRVHSVTKWKRKTSHIAYISHTIQSILQLLFLDVAPNLLTLHAPQWNNPNK